MKQQPWVAVICLNMRQQVGSKWSSNFGLGLLAILHKVQQISQNPAVDNLKMHQQNWLKMLQPFEIHGEASCSNIVLEDNLNCSQGVHVVSIQ